MIRSKSRFCSAANWYITAVADPSTSASSASAASPASGLRVAEAERLVLERMAELVGQSHVHHRPLGRDRVADHEQVAGARVVGAGDVARDLAQQAGEVGVGLDQAEHLQHLDVGLELVRLPGALRLPLEAARELADGEQLRAGELLELEPADLLDRPRDLRRGRDDVGGPDRVGFGAPLLEQGGGQQPARRDQQQGQDARGGFHGRGRDPRIKSVGGTLHSNIRCRLGA